MIRDKYNGGDQVHTASGAGIDIAHIVQATVKCSSRDLFLISF